MKRGMAASKHDALASVAAFHNDKWKTSLGQDIETGAYGQKKAVDECNGNSKSSDGSAHCELCRCMSCQVPRRHCREGKQHSYCHLRRRETEKNLPVKGHDDDQSIELRRRTE